MKPLVERFLNLFDPKEKEKYADEVWNMLQKSYEKVGGIHGSGFKNKEDMIENMPFWKIAKKNGKIVAVSLYKDKAGRKRVASGTDGTDEGKDQLEIIGKEDLTQQRAFAEVSSASLNFMLKRWKGSDITKYMILPQEAEKILGTKLEYPVSDTDPEVEAHPELKKYFYRRDIGGKLHTKLMIGKSGISIK